MKIIHEIINNGVECMRLFTSNATQRKNSIRIHHHAMIELSLIVKGSGVYKINGKTYSIRENDVFLYRPNEAHCITDIEKGGMVLLNLHIAPSYLYTAFPNVFKSNYIRILTANFPLRSSKLNDILLEKDVLEVRSLILKIKDEFTNKQADYLTATINNICNIFILIARTHDNITLQKNERRNYKKIASSIQFINEYFCTDITLDSISKHVGYGRCYFSSIFKQYMGMSIWDYISIKRIEKALSLIKTTDKNLLDIAEECGFNNSANFNKIFKKYTNLTPRDFKTY